MKGELSLSTVLPESAAQVANRPGTDGFANSLPQGTDRNWSGDSKFCPRWMVCLLGSDGSLKMNRFILQSCHRSQF